MIADKAEAEEKERRRIAPFGYVNKKENFAARWPGEDTEGREWFERAWTAYLAKVAFIQAVYSDQATCERLYAHIYPNSSRRWDQDCSWLDWQMGGVGGVEAVLIEANRKGKDRVFDRDAQGAFEEAPAGIAAYLAAPREFHTRKADTFFVRYAIDATAQLIDYQVADTKLMAKFQTGFVLVSILIQGGLLPG